MPDALPPRSARTRPVQPFSPLLLERLRSVALRLATYGQALLGFLDDPDHEPGSPKVDRIWRAVEWLVTLAGILAGDIQIAAPNPPADTPRRPRRPRRNAALETQLDPVYADLATALKDLKGLLNAYRPEPSEAAQRRAAFRRPIGELVADLCTQFGIEPGSGGWPAELIAITQTPAQWSALLRANPAHQDARTLTDLTTPPHPAPRGPTPAPAPRPLTRHIRPRPRTRTRPRHRRHQLIPPRPAPPAPPRSKRGCPHVHPPPPSPLP